MKKLTIFSGGFLSGIAFMYAWGTLINAGHLPSFESLNKDDGEDISGSEGQVQDVAFTWPESDPEA